MDETSLNLDATVNFASSFSGNYGADGAGTTTYALNVSAAGVDSGLDDTATGSDIKLYLEGGEVVGRVGSSTGAIAFKVTVDASGNVTLDQQRAIVHTPNTGPDQAVSLSAANLVQLVATITDKDGDANSATLNLGSAISFRTMRRASAPVWRRRAACRWMRPTSPATPAPASLRPSPATPVPMVQPAPLMP